ncbi:MAG: hypothetical protein M1812_005276 [Candelaria pacifica]|nr:MAG: hypothetical protein M1812_005276 [Candelaria pacifica]
MSLQTAGDIPLQIASENSASERRITPSWTIAQLKTKLEPVTGIPPSCQRLSLHISNQQIIPIEATDEDSVQLARFPLQAYALIHVHDTRPPSARQNLTDFSTVRKYTLPTSSYEALPNTVLAFKKSHQLGRFDPQAPDIEKQKLEGLEKEVEERGWFDFRFIYGL